MKKALKIVGTIVLTLVVGVAFIMFSPMVYLPHKHIEITLPFAPEDDATTNIIPMGEKFEHNASNGNPNGHPGIDFQWNKETGILAVADGRITRISKKDGKYTIEESLGNYRTVYQELNSIEPNIRAFSKVKRGQLLGHSGYLRTSTEKPTESDPSGQIHWDFASASMLVDRLCPLGYFDAESRARIEKIWANVPATDRFKSSYPEICNGFYAGREN